LIASYPLTTNEFLDDEIDAKDLFFQSQPMQVLIKNNKDHKTHHQNKQINGEPVEKEEQTLINADLSSSSSSSIWNLFF
jgi:hypothetical protein